MDNILSSVCDNNRVLVFKCNDFLSRHQSAGCGSGNGGGTYVYWAYVYLLCSHRGKAATEVPPKVNSVSMP